MKVSVYVKGDRNSTAYYRIYQYFDKLSSSDVKYNIMYPLWVQNKYMPVSKQPKPLQAIIFIASYLRVLFSLLTDVFSRPDVIVIHKRVLSRIMTPSLKFTLRICKRNGTRILWDFDDHVVAGGEMSMSTFLFFQKISDRIIVTHDYLKSLINVEWLQKVSILPTTDGDMYQLFSDEVNSNRLKLLNANVVMVWVATSGNLFNLEAILPYLEKAAQELRKSSRQLTLRVVCDKPVNFSGEALIVENIKWTREKAIDNMLNAHIGIMPLEPTEYNKGKGGFKLVQYLSVGLPCIASKHGFNEKVINESCGILTESYEQWIDAILELSNVDNWEEYSKNAYTQWNRNFSYEKNLKFWESTING